MTIDTGRIGWAVEMMAEAFGDGPFRDLLNEAGRVCLRKLKERGLEGDPSTLDPSIAEPILRAAWIEAAITVFPGADEEVIVRDMNRWFDQITMDRAANAEGSEAKN